MKEIKIVVTFNDRQQIINEKSQYGFYFRALERLHILRKMIIK